MKNDGQFLGCQATNELIEGITVEDQWRIQVHCKFKLILTGHKFESELCFSVSNHSVTLKIKSGKILMRAIF